MNVPSVKIIEKQIIMQINQTVASEAAKDLDEYAFGNTDEEKISNLAVLILKHGQRIRDLKKAFEASYIMMESHMKNATTNKDEPAVPQVFHTYRTELERGFDYVHAECDDMLKLTGKKSGTMYADSFLMKNKNASQKLLKAAALANGQARDKSLEALNKVIEMNQKFQKLKPDLLIKNSAASSKKKSKKPNAFQPYITVGKTHTAFILGEEKRFELPNPASTEFPEQYSLRETVQYLDKYERPDAKKCFNLMKQNGKVAFSRGTFEKYTKIYRDEGNLPDEGIFVVAQNENNNVFRTSHYSKNLNEAVENSNVDKSLLKALSSPQNDEQPANNADIRNGSTTNTVIITTGNATGKSTAVHAKQPKKIGTVLNGDTTQQNIPTNSIISISAENAKLNGATSNSSPATAGISTSQVLCYPIITDGETHTVFHTSPNKSFVLPNPKNIQYPKLYSLRETVEYLSKFRGKGSLELFKCMKRFDRVAFGGTTYERYAAIYHRDGKLPDANITFLKSGRPIGSKTKNTRPKGKKTKKILEQLTSANDAAAKLPGDKNGNPISYPSIEEGDTHTTFHLEPNKSYKLPNPGSIEFPKQYCLRETVLYLNQYYGKGALRLFKFMRAHGRVAFGDTTFENRRLIYRKEGKLPEPGIMYLKNGRPRKSGNDLTPILLEPKTGAVDNFSSENSDDEISLNSTSFLNKRKLLDDPPINIARYQAAAKLLRGTNTTGATKKMKGEVTPVSKEAFFFRDGD